MDLFDCLDGNAMCRYNALIQTPQDNLALIISILVIALILVMWVIPGGKND